MRRSKPGQFFRPPTMAGCCKSRDRGTWGAVAIVALAGLALGALTAYAQGWLPAELGSLANSSGSWALAAFLLALLARSPSVAAGCGSVTLLALLTGYVVTNAARGFPSGSRTVLFWGTAALLVGPFLGLGAHWVRYGRDVRAALGSGAMSGVLIGEGVYGLRYIPDTTYPPYWWGQIAVGVLLLGVVAAGRLRRPQAALLALALAVVTATLFVVIYSGSSAFL